MSRLFRRPGRTTLNHCYKTSAVLALCLLMLGGCASKRPAPGVPLQEIYSQVHRTGAQDSVALLRQGLRSRYQYSVTDPYYPLRKPEVVIPIYRPARIDRRTGNRLQGTWEHAVVERSEWVE